MSISDERHWSSVKMSKAMSVAIVAVIALLATQEAWAQGSDRSGKEVVDAVCFACHGIGTEGAPRIGDAQAWSERAAQGLTTLTQHAIDGIRQMPAHGGSPGVTDFEIKRAVTYMVNQSGGSWAEPVDKRVSRVEHSGEEVVQTHCAKCHQTGEGGAPKIGDQAAWIPRLKQGLDGAVRSAINGHGGMPPRGGVVNLSDTEIRSAVGYMFNPVSAPAKSSSVAPTTTPDARHQVIAGMAIYLGIVPTESMREQDTALHGGAPSGKGYYHVNVSLLDSESRAEITDAQVELTVKDPIMGGKTKELEIMASNEAISYGNYFRLTGWDTYSITVHVRRPGTSRAIDANFDFKP